MRIKLSRVIVFSLLALASSASIAYAWSAPTVAPTGGNVDAPINTSATAQTKTGGLTTATLDSTAISAGQVSAYYYPSLTTYPYEWNLSYPGEPGAKTPLCTCATSATTVDCSYGTIYESADKGIACYDVHYAGISTYSLKYDQVSATATMTGGSGTFDNEVTIGTALATGHIPSLKFITDTFTSKIANDAGTLKFLDNSNTAKFSFKQDGSFCFGDGSVSSACKNTWTDFSQWTTSGTNIYNSLSGNVGIGTGTATPSAKLEVNGDVNTNSGVSLTSSSALTFYPGVKSASIVPSYTTPELTDTCSTANSDTDGSGTVVNKEDGVVCTGSNAVSKCIDTAHQYVGGIDNGYASREITCVATTGTYAIKNNNNSLNFVNGTGSTKLTLDQSGNLVTKGALTVDVSSGATDSDAATNAIFIKTPANTVASYKHGTIVVDQPDLLFYQDGVDRANILAKGATFTGTVEAPTLKLTTGAGDKKILTSDANGTASWTSPVSGVPDGKTNGDTLRWDTITSKWATSTVLVNDGAKVSINGKGGVAQLVSGQTAGHTFLAFFRGLATEARSAWLGYGEDGATDFTVKNEAGGDIILDSGAGNVGINTTGPSAVLGVMGNLNTSEGTAYYTDVNWGSGIHSYKLTSTDSRDFVSKFKIGDAVKVGTLVTSVSVLCPSSTDCYYDSTGTTYSTSGSGRTTLTKSEMIVDGNTSLVAGTSYAISKDPNLFAISDGAGTTKLTVDKSGNVGIGTTPASGVKLEVNGTIAGQSVAGSGDVLKIGNDSKLVDINITNTTGLYGLQDGTIASLKLGSAGGTISGYNGNVGIGTTGAMEKLDVNGNIALGGGSDTGSNIIHAGTSWSNPFIQFWGNANSDATRQGELTAVSYGTGDIRFYNQNLSNTWNSLMAIKSTGAVSIPGTLGVTGATTLTGLLTANGGLTASTGTFSGLLTANGNMQTRLIYGDTGAGTNIADHLYVNWGKTGKGLVIGDTTNNNHPLTVYGPGNFSGLLTATGGLTIPAGKTAALNGGLTATSGTFSGQVKSNGVNVLTAETDPSVYAWAKAAAKPAETDPNVYAWAKAAAKPAETDPNVYAWAKAAVKPSYTQSEIGSGAVSATSGTFSTSLTTNGQSAPVGGGIGTWDMNVGGTLTVPDSSAVNTIGGTLNVTGATTLAELTATSFIVSKKPHGSISYDNLVVGDCYSGYPCATESTCVGYSCNPGNLVSNTATAACYKKIIGEYASAVSATLPAIVGYEVATYGFPDCGYDSGSNGCAKWNSDGTATVQYSSYVPRLKKVTCSW